MSQAENADTTSTPAETPTATAIADIVVTMENLLNEGLCLTDAMISLMEGRLTTRVKPNTIHFMAYEVQSRMERIHAEWRNLFILTGPHPAPA